MRPTQEHLYLAEAMPNVSFVGLREWYVLGAECSACGHGASIDRLELAEKFGNSTPLSSLEKNLRCCRCGSKGKSRWVVQRMPK